MTRNCDRFNGGDAKKDISDALCAYKKEKGESVYNLCGGVYGTSGGRFVHWLMSNVKCEMKNADSDTKTEKIKEEEQEPTALHRQYSIFREGCGCGCSENWYHRKRCIPALCFVRWLVRKSANEGYVEIDGKRYYPAEMAIPDPMLGDMAKLREACLSALDDYADESPMYKVLYAAISSKPRNCDTYGGDLDKLHSVWFDWTGTKDGQNDDGTVKLTFSEWLLAPSSGELPKEALHTIEKCRAENEAMQKAIHHIVFYGGEFAANRMSVGEFAAKVLSEAAIVRFRG